MKAFAQDLKAFKYAFLLRIGPETDAYGKPWTYSVVVVSDDGITATAMGFKADPEFTMAVVSAGVRVVRALGYTKIIWERKNKVDGDKIVDVTKKTG